VDEASPAHVLETVVLVHLVRLSSTQQRFVPPSTGSLLGTRARRLTLELLNPSAPKPMYSATRTRGFMVALRRS